jgi:hypothetical protein
VLEALPWRRSDLIDRIRSELWRYLTPAATLEEERLEAATLLRMAPSDLAAIGGLQFLTSTELGRLIDALPALIRRLATTTAHEEEWSAERVRGAIQWGRTIGVRRATGLPHLYVTAPSTRAFQTPENELLVWLLDETVRLGRLSGWHRSTSEGAGRLVNDRVGETERWLQSRMLVEVQRRSITDRMLARIRSGRARNRYRPVLDAWDCYRELVGTLDRRSIRRAVEEHGLISRDDPTLLELVCTFEVLGSLRNLGWALGRLGIFEGSLSLAGVRGDERLEFTYQRTPRALSRSSNYRAAQRDHGIPAGGLIPDLVLHYTGRESDRWLMIEVKGGQRAPEKSARAALLDLLAYRSAFDPTLRSQAGTYGLGIAWGRGLQPALGRQVVLCTPDTIEAALTPFCGLPS